MKGFRGVARDFITLKPTKNGELMLYYLLRIPNSPWATSRSPHGELVLLYFTNSD